MHFKLSITLCPSNDNENEEKKKFPYSLVVVDWYMPWFVQDWILPMLLVLLVVFFLIQEKNIGMLWSGLWDFYGTSSLSLCFGTRKSILCGYTNSNMVGDVDTRKSTLGYLVTFAGGDVSWQSRLQKYVALSTT